MESTEREPNRKNTKKNMTKKHKDMIVRLNN